MYIETDTVKDNWYVLTVQSIPYRKAAAVLEGLDFRFYMPFQKQLRFWSDRKKWIQVPILSPYLFLRSNELERRRIFESTHFLKFLLCDGKFAIAKNEEIEMIQQLCNYSAQIRLEQCSFKKGDPINIVQGPLAGLKGHILQENGKHRFLVQIDSLKKFASVEVEAAVLAVC